MEHATDITIILDRSGSMESIKDATIEAFNGFVHSQAKGDGVAQMSLVQFDNLYEPVYQSLSIQKVPDLNHKSYQPRGSTALLDAMGQTIVSTGERLRAPVHGSIPHYERRCLSNLHTTCDAFA